ncbi:hypothetical protein JCM1393_29550 [Clostridium carnis]
MIKLLLTILYFSLYSFLGWVCEVFYCSIPKKEFVNRGFLKGPVCPVYGFGALSVIWILGSLKINSWILLLIAGGIIASIIEFCADLLLEYVFHTRLWNYSNRKYNIKGRVCLLNSTLFGILSVVLMKILHPLFNKIFIDLNFYFIVIVSIIVTIIFILDIIFTVKEVLKLNYNLKNIDIIQDIKAKKLKRILKAFPQLEHKTYHDELKKLKEVLKYEIRKK